HRCPGTFVAPTPWASVSPPSCDMARSARKDVAENCQMMEVLGDVLGAPGVSRAVERPRAGPSLSEGLSSPVQARLAWCGADSPDGVSNCPVPGDSPGARATHDGTSNLPVWSRSARAALCLSRSGLIERTVIGADRVHLGGRGGVGV